ncbi:probable aspartyl protease At4g16563 [Diospyros lotus]|uniref:probable aspartyl protease At4g16563 n=1 Tax=Diospyros lotus TaxID=55363 RepID=UPI0022532F48|nr:probable aspartyl protease At4g16563 [Diospyros lotus]
MSPHSSQSSNISMAMAAPFLLLLPFLLSILLLTSASPSTDVKPPAATITLPLSPLTKSHHKNPLQRLNHLASLSIARAHHLKHRHENHSSPTKAHLLARGYGGYSLSLSFGTPPQTLPFIMDTGSSLVWFPCTHRYVCNQCNFENVNPAKIPTYIPKLSSSVKILSCKNPKCRWVFGDVAPLNCTTETCPPYGLEYGSGSTSGLLLSETLRFPDKAVKGFVVGCSVFSSNQPSGIAGFGRGPESLPAQMGLKKFSYCLQSHDFDDKPKSSEMVLTGRSDSGDGETSGLSYTRFIKNKAASNSAFQEYYYVNLRKISVGGKHLKVPYRFLVPGSDGNGGTMVDSGTTFTFMEKKVFEVVAQEFTKQMANYSRATDVEKKTGLRPCYKFSEEKSVKYSELVFHFKGGAEMALPAADYFSIVDGLGAVCLTIVTDDDPDAPELAGGPSIILGNYQQQNIYLEYDLEKERLGFRKQICR